MNVRINFKFKDRGELGLVIYNNIKNFSEAKNKLKNQLRKKGFEAINMVCTDIEEEERNNQISIERGY